ncbi:MAG: alpha/beta hydrolase fold domain-containing protein [Selenomonas sp.]|nr:alpha/beta hydrolase fold domain-containing protein [Selenomonas sp.]
MKARSGIILSGAMAFCLALGAGFAHAALPDQQHGLQLSGAEKQAYISEEVRKFLAPLPGETLPVTFHVPAGWKLETFSVNGVHTERLQTDAHNSSRVILQLHGGGYVDGLSDVYRAIGVRQASITKAKEIYFVDYRLAPQYVYPAALDDATTVYKELLDRGIPAKNIILSGDSAGGNLALALALRLKETGIPQPGCIVVASPWADFEHREDTTRTTNAAKDQVLGNGTPLNGAVQHPAYAGKLSLNDPRLSLIHADFSGLPPLLIQTGGHEIFLAENNKLAEKAANDGVEVTHTVYAGMPHDFALLLPQMEETLDFLAEQRDFICRYMES